MSDLEGWSRVVAENNDQEEKDVKPEPVIKNVEQSG